MKHQDHADKREKEKLPNERAIKQSRGRKLYYVEVVDDEELQRILDSQQLYNSRS